MVPGKSFIVVLIMLPNLVLIPLCAIGYILYRFTSNGPSNTEKGLVYSNRDRNLYKRVIFYLLILDVSAFCAAVLIPGLEQLILLSLLVTCLIPTTLMAWFISRSPSVIATLIVAGLLAVVLPIVFGLLVELVV